MFLAQYSTSAYVTVKKLFSRFCWLLETLRGCLVEKHFGEKPKNKLGGRELATPVNSWLYTFMAIFALRFNNCRQKLGGTTALSPPPFYAPENIHSLLPNRHELQTRVVSR